MGGRRFGVEEELLLVNADTGEATGLSTAVLRIIDSDGVEKELQQEQIETDTAPVVTADDMHREIIRLRAAAATAAEKQGVHIAALATSPTPTVPSPTPDHRYDQMIDLYRMTASEQLTCGMHVHVETESPGEAVGALDRIRSWLPVLLALSSNSPFWQGRDTGYESSRTRAWSRWPSAGPTGVFGSHQSYRRVVDGMLATKALLDEGMLYFDARLGVDLPTVEVRVADVCLYADDALLLAALTRALVDTAAQSWHDEQSAPQTPTEVLRLAAWRASRSGLTGALIHPDTGTEAPAWDIVGALRRHVADSLDEAGAQTVDDLLDQLHRRGTGAHAQRQEFERTGDLAEVVRDAVGRTAPQQR